MASPIGHGLMGYALCVAAGQPLRPRFLERTVLCVVLAALPDADFIPGLLMGDAGMFHQGPSHSFVAAAVVGFVAALWYVRGGSGFGRAWLLFATAYASHLLLDFFGPDTSPPIGMPLLWPFSQEHFLGPVRVLLGIDRTAPDTSGMIEWIRGLLIPYNAAALAREVLVVGPLALLATGVWLWRRTARNDAES